jgi:hypothetical protein
VLALVAAGIVLAFLVGYLYWATGGRWGYQAADGRLAIYLMALGAFAVWLLLRKPSRTVRRIAARKRLRRRRGRRGWKRVKW